MTVSMLARRCGLSRTTLLYYESRGLLRKPPRTSGNYRAYTEHDALRVQQIGLYRKVGLGVREIGALLDRPAGGAASILERRLVAIDGEVETLRNHQRAILRLLQQPQTFGRRQMMTKDKWVAIMRAAGFSEQDMHRWHTEFEHNAPQEHQEFLEFLHVDPDEIARIREASRKGAHQ
jgi:MerR family transcriptional regulator, thiopeptide resistance regulator